MIISVRVANYMVFRTGREFSMKADRRIRKYSFNAYERNGYSILSEACIFGPNSAGKTCLVNAIRIIRDVMLGKAAGNEIIPCRYGGDAVSSLGISFYYNGKAYSYDLRYDCAGKSFVYECLMEIARDSRGVKRPEKSSCGMWSMANAVSAETGF
ncbi:MAG: hypothetical protein LUE27_07905 [Clostridia bacterium]|nr:hypothetical protein [Clostridia bacterium]